MKTCSLRNNNHNKSCSPHQIMEVFNRELGFNPPKMFHRRFSASKALISRIGLAGELIGHEGFVNTVEFNSCGDRLVSGSDDRRVMLWNVAAKALVLSYDSGHVGNIFQARIMPFTGDRTIVTSAGDGQVRLGQVADNGNVLTLGLGTHDGYVHKLAVEPGSPNIVYSCGEDGLVQHFDLRTNSSTKLFCCSTFTGNNYLTSSNKLSLNSIIIDPRDPNYFSIGGSDVYARVYDIRKLQLVETFCPKHLINDHDVHITGMSYSNTSELLVAYSGECMYLFQKNMGLGPYPVAASSQEVVDSLEEPQIYSGHRHPIPVKGVSFLGPDSEYVVTGSDCGHIFIWNKKDGNFIRIMEGNMGIVNQVEPHPNILGFASSGFDKNIKLWAPVSDKIPPLVHSLGKVMESNRKLRESFSRVRLRPEVLRHFTRHTTRQ